MKWLGLRWWCLRDSLDHYRRHVGLGWWHALARAVFFEVAGREPGEWWFEPAPPRFVLCCVVVFLLFWVGVFAVLS